MFFKKKENGPVDWIIVGLGNPGKKYENTRHNTGFFMMDGVAQCFEVKLTKRQFNAHVARGTMDGINCLLMKPDTFMNKSGEAVLAAMEYYHIPADHVLVLSDDIALGVGRIRIRKSGSSGGQNGLRNIIDLIGTEEFPRVRFGVGNKPHPDYDLAKWVLSTFKEAEQQQMREARSRVPDIIRLILVGRIDEAISKYNS